MGFIVFGIPSANVDRFIAQYAKEAQNCEYSLERFARDINGDLMEALGQILKRLHKAGYAHRQPHFGNFYKLGKQIFLADWSTIVPLGTTKREQSMNRSIDLQVVRQNVEILYRSIYRGPDLAEAYSLNAMSHLLTSYFGKPTNVAKIYESLLGTGMDNLEESEVIVSIVEGKGRIK